MTITRIAHTEATVGANGSGVVTVDVSGLTLLEDDFLLVCGVNDDSNNNTFSSSDLTLVADFFVNDTNDTNLFVGYVVIGASPPTQIQVSGFSALEIVGVNVLQYRGVDTTTPLDVTSVSTGSINSDLANPPSITPVTSGAKIVACYGGSRQNSASWTAPANMSNFNELEVTSLATIATADADWTSGTFDPDPVTGGDGNTRNSWAAATLALRPSGGGGGTITFSFGTIF